MLGLYNPFTLSGNIIVNGVAASVQSEWFLDSAADKFGMASMLPDIYQVRSVYVWLVHHLANQIC